MECCSDVHNHQDNHFQVDHNHLDHPFSYHSSFQGEVVGYLEVHLHNDAFAAAHLEVHHLGVHLGLQVVVVLLYCYTSCVVEVPLEDVDPVNNFQVVLQGRQEVLPQVVVHQDQKVVFV